MHQLPSDTIYLALGVTEIKPCYGRGSIEISTGIAYDGFGEVLVLAGHGMSAVDNFNKE